MCPISRIFKIMKYLKVIFKSVSAIVFTIAVLPIFIPLALFFVAYRKCIDFILRRRIGEKYGGLLSGGDQHFAQEQEVRKNVVTALLMVDSAEEDFFTAVKGCFKRRIFDPPESLPKFTGVFKQAYGYFYVLKNEYSVDECVREVVDEVRDQRDLQGVLNKYSVAPLPKNHTAFWEVLVCRSPIQWNDSQNCFPIIIRCHHSMGDGKNLMHAFSTFFNDDLPILQSKPTVSNSNTIEKIVSSLKKIISDIHMMIKLPSFLFNAIFSTGDCNDFQKKPLSGKLILAWKIDDGDMVTRIKTIKNKFPGTTFTDVLITAISASYEEHMTHAGLNVPENFTIAYPIDFNPPDAFEKPPVLVNKFSGLSVPTPISWTSKSLIEKLKEVNRRQIIAKGNDTISANYWLFTIIPTYLPLAAMKPSDKMSSLTVSISNLPGIPYWTIFGRQVVDLISFASHFGTSGMSLMFVNYGGQRLQLGFLVDKALINSAEEIDGVLNGVKRYVNVMYEELDKNRH